MKELKEKLTDILRYNGINMDNTDLKARIMHCMEKAYALDRDEWIPAQERLPLTQGDGKEYLCRGLKGNRQHLSPDEQERYAEYVVCWFDANQFHESHSGRVYNDNSDLYFITHWMPLPKPPQS